MADTIQPPCIFPTFRFKHAAIMIHWLQQAFGFIVHAKYMDGDSVVTVLRLISTLSMIYSARLPMRI
jgi:hypothetical protein